MSFSKKEELLREQIHMQVFSSLPSFESNSSSIGKSQDLRDKINSEADRNERGHLLGLREPPNEGERSRDKERILRRSVQTLQKERDYLVEKLNKLLAMLSKIQTQMENMGGQANMMLMLLRDLMNQA